MTNLPILDICAFTLALRRPMKRSQAKKDRRVLKGDKNTSLELKYGGALNNGKVFLMVIRSWWLSGLRHWCKLK